MKRNTILIGLTLMLGLIISSCADNDEVNPINKKTKEELRAEVVNLSTAVEAISNSKGFDIITSKLKTRASTEDRPQNILSMKITLDDIKGEYVYQKDASRMKRGGFSDFKKVKDTSLFIMKLPKEIIHKPWRSRGAKTENKEPVNNFMVTTKKYHSEYVINSFNFNYELESDIRVDSVDIGTLAVDWEINQKGINYNAQFKFPEDYLIGADLDLSKENAKYEYFLMKDDKALYKEKCAITPLKDSLAFTYGLIVGNIEIKLVDEKYVILRDGKEDKDAKVEIIISENKEKIKADVRFMGAAMLFSSGLDLKITFANKDVVMLSELIGEGTLAKMKQLFESMYDMRFVKNIVDRVAKQVYFMNKYESK